MKAVIDFYYRCALPQGVCTYLVFICRKEKKRMEKAPQVLLADMSPFLCVKTVD